MLPLHPQVVSERVSIFRLEWMSHVFEAGLTQTGQPVPPDLVGKGYGSIYAQLWAKIVGGGVPPVPESAIVSILNAPPPPKELKIETTAGASEVVEAKPAEPETTDPERVPTDVEDWESDVVIQPRDLTKLLPVNTR